MDRWAMRNEAIAQLEAVMDEVSGPVASHSSPSRDQQGTLYLCVPCAVAHLSASTEHQKFRLHSLSTPHIAHQQATTKLRQA